MQDFYRNSNGNRWQPVRDQGALSWELRAATSLALLLRDQGRFGPGRRLYAQTAMIENGFVHIPETHEMTVFPKGKHDDQADSTAQFLD